MAYSYYITPKEYEIAESNGISAKNLNKRVREYGWKVEDAITKPLRKNKQKIDRKWFLLAKKNGIKYNTFLVRVRKGMDLKQAATEPAKTKQQVVEIMNKSKVKIDG